MSLLNISTDCSTQHSWCTVKDFFDDYSLAEISAGMKAELITCLTTDNVDFVHPEQRADLIRRHERLQEVLAALYRIVMEKRNQDVEIFN